MQGPIFRDGTFDYVPIPDSRNIDNRTYGNTQGRKGRPLAEYFPPSRREKMSRCSIHFDPECSTFTYGDPTHPKKSLRKLQKGDLLVFYAGLEGWGFNSPPALYVIGYFEVEMAGIASDFESDGYVRDHFGENFHVRHEAIYQRQKKELVLVKGSRDSRLLQRAVLISAVGHDVDGRDLKVLSRDKLGIFGDFGGRISIQRSPPRWIDLRFVKKSAGFVRSLQ